MTDTIYGFNEADGTRWLSNFFVEEDGLTGEHWFQATKATEYSQFIFVMDSLTPGEAKKRGRQIELREDWEEVKDEMMLNNLHRKFADPALREKLLATGEAKLVEANTWNDTYWGVDKDSGVGQNMLGILLMQVRDEIRGGYVL